MLRLVHGTALLIALTAASAAMAQTGGLFSGRQPFNPTGSTSIAGGRSGNIAGPGGGAAAGTADLLNFGLSGSMAQLGAVQLPTATGVLGQPASATGFVGRTNTGFVGNWMASQQGMAGGRAAGRAGQNLQGQNFQMSNPLMQSQLGTQRRQQTRTQQANAAQRLNANTGLGGVSGVGGFGVNPFGQVQQGPPQVSQRVSFVHPAPATVQVTQQIATQLDRIALRRPEFQQVGVGLEADGTAVLTGSVPTQQAARLAESLLRLEPGVRAVRNELTVAP